VGSSARMTAGSLTKRPRDGHALLLAARELARMMRLAIGEPHRLQARPGAAAALAGGEAGVEQGKLDVLERGSCAEQVELLEDEPDLEVSDPRERVGARRPATRSPSST